MPLPRPTARDRILTVLEVTRAECLDAPDLDNLLAAVGVPPTIAVPGFRAPVSRLSVADELLDAAGRLAALDDRGLDGLAEYGLDEDVAPGRRLAALEAELSRAESDLGDALLLLSTAAA